MLELFGSDFVAQHILQVYQQEQKEHLYRVYVTESLWCIVHGKGLEAHYKDLLEPRPEKAKTETAEEIITRFNAKLARG